MKDKSNLFNYNQWTLGEYKNNLVGLTFPTETQQVHTISTEWSSIGESSLKIISSQTSDYIRIWNLNSFQNKKITGKCTINTKENCDVLLREFNQNNELVTISYARFNGCGEIILSLTSSNTENNKFLLSVSNVSKDRIIYIDDAYMS